MKTLTLHQPHATLFAIGVRFIETRSWSTKYRGPLAIHAGVKKPSIWWSDRGERDPIARGDQPWHYLLEPYLAEWETNDLDWAYQWAGPLGAVVATCELVDVVPILEFPTHIPNSVSIWIEVDGPRLTLQQTEGHWKDVSDQRPYGNFTPGRFAWILDDIKPLSVPIPAKGKQGLFEWNPA